MPDVTPETLTRYQILAAAEWFGLAGQPHLVTDCYEALGRSDMFWGHEQPTEESILAARRRRCAGINARRGKEHP